MAHAFISYSHKDKKYAHKLADQMKRRGIDVWIDDRINYGDQWPRVIQENLEQCPIFIVIVTTNAYNSQWVQDELIFARDHRKFILPLLVEGKTWLTLASSQFVDVQGGKMPPETFYSTVKRHLKLETVKAGWEFGRPRLLRVDERGLRELIVRQLQAAIKDDQERKWEVGIFKLGYRHISLKAELYLLGNTDYHILRSEVINEDLLKRFDPEVYADYSVNHDALLKDKGKPGKSPAAIQGKKRVVRTKPSSRRFGDPYTTGLIALRRRLNLHLGETFFHIPSDTELQQFAAQLIQLHKLHHIPANEIKVRAVG